MNRRLKYFVEPAFQRSFLIYSLLLGVACLIAFFIGDILFIRELKQMGATADLPKYHVYFSVVQYQEQKLWLLFTGGAASITLFTMTYGLLMSNRIAGPIFRLRKHLQATLLGKHETLHFREKDYFSDLAKEVNDVTEALRLAREELAAAKKRSA